MYCRFGVVLCSFPRRRTIVLPWILFWRRTLVFWKTTISSPVADAAMLGSQGTYGPTGVTQAKNVRTCNGLKEQSSAWLSEDVLSGRCDTGVGCQDLQWFKWTVRQKLIRRRTDRQVWHRRMSGPATKQVKGTVKWLTVRARTDRWVWTG